MSVNTNRYYERKAAGVCVRCEAPRSGRSVLCEEHLNYSRSRRKAKAPDDAPWAINSAVEPPREPYRSDKEPVMPPVPDKCPRCKGLVVTQYDETRCLPCGWYLQPVQISADPTYGAQLPAVVRV